MAGKTIFIGRDKEIKQLNKDVFGISAEEGGGKFRSIIGPNGIGKTFLVKKLSEQLRGKDLENVNCFWTSIETPPEESKLDAFWLFWIGLIKQFSKKIKMEELELQSKYEISLAKEIQEIYDFFDSDQELNHINEPGTNARALDYLNTIFVNYAGLGIRTIIVIDEFDRAKETFTSGTFFQRLYDLSPKARGVFDDELNLSILLLCRRSVGTIAHGMKKGSNLEDAYPAMTIRGFNDTELEEYFSLYHEPLSEMDRNTIKYFCGRSPALLMRIYEELNSQEEDEPKSSLTASIRAAIRVPYEHMCKIMKTEYVDLAKEQNCMGKFVQAFIGPAYDENLAVYMEKLYSYGYVTMNSDKEGYASLVKCFDQEWNLQYDPIAPYFIEYVRRTVLIEDLTGLERNMWYLEDEVRRILRIMLQNKFGEDWKEHIDDYIGEGRKDYFLAPLQRMAEEMGAEERGFVYSKLDVLSFTEYGIIITKEWNEMKKYFSSYQSKRELKDDLYIIRQVRNSYAHRTQDVFSREYIDNARQICDGLIKDIANVTEG